MKIKLAGGKVLQSDAKVDPQGCPAVSPAAPPKRKGCASAWTWVDWALLAFLIVLGGFVAFNVGKVAYYRFGELKKDNHHDEPQHKSLLQKAEDEGLVQKAECKVVSIKDNGWTPCEASCKSGMEQDQKERLWWDWMDKDDVEDDLIEHHVEDNHEESKEDGEKEDGEDLTQERMRRSPAIVASKFPCQQILVEVNTEGYLKDWEEEEDFKKYPHPCKQPKKRDDHDESREESDEEEEHMEKQPLPENERTDGGATKKPTRHVGTLYDSVYTAWTYPKCSLSICKSSPLKNKACVRSFVSEYKKMMAEGEVFPCAFNPERKEKVMELEPEYEEMHVDDDHSFSVTWTLVGGIAVCTWLIALTAFVARRICQCKRSARRRCQHASAMPAPEVVTVDTPQTELSEKEKEALGQIPPPETPRAVWTVSAPPSYTSLGDYKTAVRPWSSSQERAPAEDVAPENPTTDTGKTAEN
jgi:hypothetical protein